MRKADNHAGYEIQRYSISGWKNASHDKNGAPLIFLTREGAEIHMESISHHHNDELRIYEALN